MPKGAKIQKKRQVKRNFIMVEVSKDFRALAHKTAKERDQNISDQIRKFLEDYVKPVVDVLEKDLLHVNTKPAQISATVSASPTHAIRPDDELMKVMKDRTSTDQPKDENDEDDAYWD